MRKVFCIIFVVITSITRAQVAETRNITPYTKGLPVQFENITVAVRGSDIFLQGKMGDKVVLFNNDGLYWRDVSKSNDVVSDVRHFFSVKDSLVYMVTPSDRLAYWSESRESNGFTEWSKDFPYSKKPKQAYGMNRTGERLFQTGVFSNEKGVAYYVSQRYETVSWNWVPVLQKKTPPEIVAIFENYTAKQVTGAKKNDIYVLLQDPASPKTVILKWNNKEWKILGEPRDSLRTILVDNDDNLYVNGDVTTADGKDCILRWDGKAWTELVVDGLKRRTPKVMTLDEKGKLFVGGLAPSGKEYFVLEWDGSTFKYFGAAPASMHSMIVANENAYVIGKGKEGGVYMVPRGGLVTANTAKRLGEKKDKLAEPVWELYRWYGGKYLVSTDEAYTFYTKNFLSSAKANAVALQNIIRSTLNNFFYVARDSIRNLQNKLRVGDNLFFDAFKELYWEQYQFYSEVGYHAEYAQNQFHNMSDIKGDVERAEKQYKKGSALVAKLSDHINAYGERNKDLVMRPIELDDPKATLKPDAKTLALYEAFKTFKTKHPPLKNAAKTAWDRLTSSPRRETIEDNISKNGSAVSDEQSLLWNIASKLRATSDMQTEAAAFATAIQLYIDARQEVMTARREAGDKIMRTDLTTDTRMGYISIAAKKDVSSEAAYERYLTAITRFEQKFSLK